MQAAQPTTSTPIVVTVVPATPARERTVGDVIIGALSLTGVLILIALALGVVFAAVRYAWHRRHPPHEDHLPPVAPGTVSKHGS
ncbi:MAG TPA: hypothetical protein VHB78_04280 [Vicinamibacterales bacterium]|nr:hypothetical protein [Vicinamibacterales bacterium]